MTNRTNINGWMNRLQDSITAALARSTGISLPQDSGGQSLETLVELLEGDDRWLEPFTQRLEANLQRVADRLLDEWTGNTRSQYHSILRELESELQEVAGRALTGSSFRHQRRQAGQGNELVPQLASLAISAGLRKLLHDEKTTTRESEHSRREVGRYRASRGQMQAELSSQLARGRRYL